jgi:hypothetical protein
MSSDEQLGKGCLWTIGILFGFVLIAGMLSSGSHSTSPLPATPAYSPPEPPTPSEPAPAAQTESSQTQRSFVGWTKWSNGRTWNSASDSDKMDLCRRLASVTTKGNSAAFYYDALNAFYKTTDSQILDTSLDDATRLIEAGSSALPESSRKY